MSTDIPKPEPTMPLDDFRELYKQDDNEWWRLQSGDMQNLFDAAIDRIEGVEEVVAEMELHVEVHSHAWFYLLKLKEALARNG